MRRRPLGWPPSIVAFIAMLVAGCATDAMMEPGGDDSGAVDPSDEDGDTTANDDTQPPPPVVCNDPSAYTPYTTAAHPTGRASTLPWHGVQTTYPASVEDFRGYGLATVECSNQKSTRSHLDVTAGCLSSIADTHGQIASTSDGAFRAVVLGYTDADPAHAIRWTEQSIEYSFLYAATSGEGVLPGFKAFARYNTEEDLYVASWRMDGVVQIQRKQCGVYTALKVLKSFGAPTPGSWHRMKFSAVGNVLELSLDGVKVITVTDNAFASGTMGIRTDAMTGALIDDWRVN
jgi:hypothetical protein